MDQRQVFLRDILTVLFKRKVFIITFVVAVFALVFVGNYLWPPTYESSARVQIQRGRETVGVDPSVLESVAMPMVQMSTYDVNTIISLVYSNDVLRAVVEETGIDKGLTGGLLQAVRGAVRRVQYALRFKSEPDAVQEAAQELRQALDVEPVKDSYVLEIRCRMAKAELAERVLASLIDNFREKHEEVYSTEELQPFFEDQLKRVGIDLTKAQLDLKDFRNKNNVVSLDVERDLLVEQYTNAQRLLDQLAATEAVAAEAVEGDVGEADMIAALSRQTEGTVVTELQLRLLDKIVERNRTVTSLGPKHPKVLGIKQEITELNGRLREAIDSTRTVTEGKLTEIDGQMKNINTLLGELENLEREAELAGDSYEYYKSKIEEARVYDEMGKKGISSIRVTSAPTLPDNPVSPRKLFNLALALIGGIIGGVAIAFFIEYLDHGLKTPEDVEHFVKVPPLASFFRSPYEQLDPKQAQRLSTMLDNIYPDGPIQMLAVSSSVAGEGAHRVARALAEAQSDDPEARTLLLDFVGDGLQESPSGRGILDVLEGDAGLDEVIASIGNLYVVGRGTRPDCPTYLWKSDRMQALIQGLRQEFVRIIVHVAPILASHDALNMTHHADGVLIVIRADGTRREVVQRAIETLGESKDKVLGAVLTERVQVIPQAVYRRI